MTGWCDESVSGVSVRFTSCNSVLRSVLFLLRKTQRVVLPRSANSSALKILDKGKLQLDV